jgi:hypothetical protein
MDLKSDATRFKKRIISVTIVANVRRFCQQINTDEVFGTHRFKETAREVGADQSNDAFDRVLDQLAPPKKPQEER